MAGNDNKIRNVGPKSAAWLRQVGVRSTEDLARVGVVEAFLKVKRAGFRPSLNLLYSMAGALADCHWNEVPEAQRQELVAALEAAESANPIRSRWDRQKAASEGIGPAGGEGGDETAPMSQFDEPDRDEQHGGGDDDRDRNRFD